MPRQLRIQYPGAIYHILSRGDRREDIFHDDVVTLGHLEERDHPAAATETKGKYTWPDANVDSAEKQGVFQQGFGARVWPNRRLSP